MCYAWDCMLHLMHSCYYNLLCLHHKLQHSLIQTLDMQPKSTHVLCTFDQVVKKKLCALLNYLTCYVYSLHEYLTLLVHVCLKFTYVLCSYMHACLALGGLALCMFLAPPIHTCHALVITHALFCLCTFLVNLGNSGLMSMAR